MSCASTGVIEGASLAEGRDYEPILPPQPAESSGKIEVWEFFSYGRPHGKDFHPLVMAWAYRLPGYVDIKRVPVTFVRVTWSRNGLLPGGNRWSGARGRCGLSYQP